ncbi:hypothetical protein OsJ_04374 [Oryza sativa Japonica Group]|uniref:Uncharacterized protein n=1 Tax=Oryza sativa subsp. japonica TaxID=39947 RepID=B9EVA7_ORYSJ|nr:hypothetical protein OsJ_04374 [Oryza sativa Japonica Group]
MYGKTTKFLGPLLPSFLKIDILPEALRGNIDPTSCQEYLNNLWRKTEQAVPPESFVGNLQLSGKPLSRPCEPFFLSPDGAPTDGRGSGGGSVPVAEKKKKKKLSGAVDQRLQKIASSPAPSPQASAAFQRDVVDDDDEELLVLLVEVGDDGEEVGVGERRRMCSEKSFSSCCASPPALPPDPAAMASS